MTNSSVLPQRLAILDGWRGLAILAVLVGHFLPLPGINAGRLGVELFFVLSGRLMAEILFVRKVALTQFFGRRFARIFPAMLVFSVAIFAFTNFANWHAVSFAQWLTLVTFSYNYLYPVVGVSENIGHIWSLCVEEHLYILLATLAFLARRFRRINVIGVCCVLIGLCVTNGVFQSMSGADYYHVYWRSDVRGASILMGCTAYLIVNKWGDEWNVSAWVPLIAGVAGVCLSINPVPDPLRYSLGTACFAVTVALIGHLPKVLTMVLANRAVVYCGLLSYSLYLWQQPFFNASRVNIMTAPFLMGAAVCCGWLSFRWIEGPARQWLNWMVERATTGKDRSATDKPSHIGQSLETAPLR